MVKLCRHKTLLVAMAEGGDSKRVLKRTKGPGYRKAACLFSIQDNGSDPWLVVLSWTYFIPGFRGTPRFLAFSTAGLYVGYNSLYCLETACRN